MDAATGLRDHVTRLADVRCRPEDGDRFLLYNPRTDELHMLGGVEKSVYDLCDGRCLGSVIEAAAPLLDRRGVFAPDAAAAEVLAFLRQLERRGLVEFG